MAAGYHYLIDMLSVLATDNAGSRAVSHREIIGIERINVISPRSVDLTDACRAHSEGSGHNVVTL